LSWTWLVDRKSHYSQHIQGLPEEFAGQFNICWLCCGKHSFKSLQLKEVTHG